MGTKLRPGDPGLLPRTFAGRYELIELIASGGMADVYRARDSLLDRDVAIKVLPDHLSNDPSFVARFQREAKAAARLVHPNIVSLFDYGSDGGTSFIVMEFVEGRTVCDTLEDTPRLSPGRAAEVAIGVARALARAHAAGVVHRDITSSNVMINEYETKVADFGISHTLSSDDQATTARNGVIVGTAAYLSPEQARRLTHGPAFRHLLTRDRPLRDAHRKGAVPERIFSGDRLPSHHRPSRSAVAPQCRRPRVPGGDRDAALWRKNPTTGTRVRSKWRRTCNDSSPETG